MPVVGTKKSRKMRGGANSGIYNFKEDHSIYFFSDLEGNMPDGIKNLMFDTPDTPKTLGKEVIVFTGDLIDRGEYTIRNLQRMLALKLKTGNANNVILLCGNRDANKIRMYHECHIQAIEEKILKSKDKSIDIQTILQELQKIDTVFTNSSLDIEKIIDIKGINGPNDDRPVFSGIYSDDISRITKMYSNTLGSPKQIEFFATEFELLFGIDKGFWDDKNNTLLKFIAMMNMVMGKVWKEDELPDVLARYNGLYIKYLQECHIMASITIGTKLCIVSHAGIPYNETLRTFYIPTEIGIVPTPRDISVVIQNKEPLTYNGDVGKGTNGVRKGDISHFYGFNNIQNLNSSFTTFLTGIEKGDTGYTKSVYKKYVAMSANCDTLAIEDREFSAYASPIVSHKDLEGVKRKEGLDLDKFRYGSITHIYNIFGHQPSGLLPYISRNSKKTSYHIDLDISRAENPIISNKESYVYLRITKDEDMLFGKTVLNNIYHSIKGKEDQLQEAQVLDGLPRIIYNEKEGEKKTLNINYEGDTTHPLYSLQSYCDNVLQASYTTENQKTGKDKLFTSTLFTVGNNKYYGSFSWTLVEYDKSGITGGRGNVAKAAKAAKAYVKSIKRLMYGKRNMVIYLGKRGGEYVKVKGEYMSLAKFRGKKRI